jgi:hypothetical protein
MKMVIYEAPTSFNHRGRNGLMKACGVVAQKVGDEVFLQAVVSDGRVSDAARLVVPVARIPDLIKALEAQL